MHSHLDAMSEMQRPKRAAAVATEERLAATRGTALCNPIPAYIYFPFPRPRPAPGGGFARHGTKGV